MERGDRAKRKINTEDGGGDWEGRDDKVQN